MIVSNKHQLPPEITSHPLYCYVHLSPHEIELIKKRLKRVPTMTELILFSIEGSEHCSYKSSRVHLKKFNTTSPDVIIGAKEDAGIIAIATDKQNHRYGIAISHESHNHPSQIVPYEGAATGVGGNLRDVSCMGAEVIALADSLRFGDIKDHKTQWLQRNVINGIADYGNATGIPNIAGDIDYHQKYSENCLVTVVTIGIVKEDHILRSKAPKNATDYDIILIGKPTDESGFGGASFASDGLDLTQKKQNRGAIQDPNAFLGRHLLKSSYMLFQELIKKNIIHDVGFKDLGAGGIACASAELAESGGYGAEIWLDRVKTAYNNISPTILLCSETQERYMWVCHPKHTDFILNHYNKEYALPTIAKNAYAHVIGKIRNDNKYKVYHHKELLADIDVDILTQGFQYQRPTNPPLKHPPIDTPSKPCHNHNTILLNLLAHPSIASKECVYEKYDKHVQGRNILECGMGDAGIITPFNDIMYPKEIQNIGVALTTDQNPRYNAIDSYWGAVNAIIEAMSNIVAVGAYPIALTDCLCYGNPENPQHQWHFIEGIRGINDVSKAIHLYHHREYTIPIIAGNVSLYNESSAGDSIPPSPMIACLGKINDVSKHIDMSFKNIGDIIYLIGERKNEMGGSIFYECQNETGGYIPHPDFKQVESYFFSLIEACEKEMITALHDISTGGMATAITEMCFKNKIGCKVNIPQKDTPADITLYSESHGFIAAISPKNIISFEEILKNHDVIFYRVGECCKQPIIQIQEVIDISIDQCYEIWQNALRKYLR